ncbi:hypothetical protein F5Y19DRAFT_474581 [Xylariaceae sp. FL1651]|nr:hypothetical protein F5Y19DRAFT_474581 [Xylariaceae sp. FL1651]
MTQASVVTQYGSGSQGSSANMQQSLGTLALPRGGSSQSGQSENQSSDRTLSVSGLGTIPKMSQLSDWLLRSDDPFPYGRPQETLGSTFNKMKA